MPQIIGVLFLIVLAIYILIPIVFLVAITFFSVLLYYPLYLSDYSKKIKDSVTKEVENEHKEEFDRLHQKIKQLHDLSINNAEKDAVQKVYSEVA